MTTNPPADPPERQPHILLEGAGSEQGRVYQAAGEQTVNNINHQMSRRPLPNADSMQVPPGLAGLPRRPASIFVGRDAALAALREALQGGADAGVISQAVLGLGGVGKSELALQYAHRYRSEYRPVWWIDSDSPTQIQAGLAALARALSVGTDSVAAEQATVQEAAAWALTWLTVHSGWLVIFDNVEEVSDIEPYLARVAHGHVLITTRRDIGWQHLNIAPIRLNLLTRSASTALLADLIGPADSADAHRLEELADHLGDLPLALAQAGAYIARTPRMSSTKYLNLLKDDPARMYAAAPTAGDAEQVVAKVWTLSHARIQAINPLASQVLNVLACFAPDNLPCTVLCGLPDADELQVYEALALLASYSLITLTRGPEQGHEDDYREDLVSMHRLIQTVTLHQLSPGQRDNVRHNAAELLLAALPGNPDLQDNWPHFARLLPHALTVLPATSSELWNMARYLGVSGDYRTAKTVTKQICDDLVTTLGAEHPNTLILQANVAVWTARAGDAATARDQLAALVPQFERVFGADHLHSLTAQHELARFTGQAGDPATARDQLAVLVSVEERVFGTSHVSTLISRANLAFLVGKAGDPVGARDQYAALLPIQTRVLGAEHPEILSARHNLAGWTGEAGNATEARDQFAALVPLFERVLGIDHPDTLSARLNLSHWTRKACAAGLSSG